jgi:tetratricopeptide (TPR) repeat protein
VVAFRNLLSATSEETRARAVLGGIECAMDAGDEHAAYSFAEAWFPINQGAWERDVVRTALKLDARGWERVAFVLVETEHRRKRGPFIAYAHARLCEARGDYASAFAAWESCAAAAEGAGVKRLGTVARLEIARAHGRSPESRAAALALAKSVDSTSLPARQKMQHARILASSSSRFERAVLAGGFGPDPAYGAAGAAVPQARAAGLALVAIAHAKRGTLAPSHLSDVTRALEGRAPAPPAAASLCVLALSSNATALHEEAARLASAIVERRGSVSIGFVRLADALSSRGRDDVAESALRLAESMGEEGASARLVSALLRQGRAAAHAGKRTEALRRLREVQSRNR